MRKILSIVACFFLGELALTSHIHAEEAAGTQVSADQSTNTTTVVSPPKPHVDTVAPTLTA